MTKLNEIYKCNICGNIVEMTHTGVGELVCCGQPMQLMEEQTKGEYAEKHAPVIEREGKIIKVKVGSIEHPMEEKHFIEWIEILANGRVYRRYLKPGWKPETKFQLNPKPVIVRMYCNIHGLWKA